MSFSEEAVLTLDQALGQLSLEARELYLDHDVPILDQPLTPLSFYREYVSPNKPVLIRNGLQHWSAITKWTPDYLREKLGERVVTVAVTPNGYADAITDGKFVMPEERQMAMSEFLDIMDHPDQYNGVFYIQKQNSNFIDEFEDIIGDVEPDIPWGTEAFGLKPDAVNFWMGDTRAVTSMHKDHYENLYCVVRGWKKFILIPPTDSAFVPYDTYQAAKFTEKDGTFHVEAEKETGQIPWIAVNPLAPNSQKYPEFGKARMLEVFVKEGEILYLPSLWYHHVQQSHGCIAVNYWYDMQYDIKYNYYNFLQNVNNINKSMKKD
ncbi:bifunctional peptidase and (3S)-lysyl hydroxylase Jmjd7-like [Ostrea edulis]|uniref:bifunctional peptidase and (3S)-lysyl hydroxylase Jmjd7-like n=1 Tax=Ostrea edulis TaxID=37623 RepID=UPI0024AFC5FF|nr:bifunctional peptidase and (3S)-lysyl hydroxylase Jmjd7-like [Ostrea edulis]